MIAIAFALLFVLLFLRVPIATATGLVGLAGLSILQSPTAATAQLGIIATDTILTYEFAVIPLFIAMGAFVANSGIAADLFTAFHAFVGHRRGGLALSTILACGGFGAVSGSSLATAATMSRVAFPSMQRFGYSDALASGSIAAGGTLGILIPPSVALVFFGILTQTDIGALFAAGLIPGLIGIALYAVAVLWIVSRDPEAGPASPRASFEERRRALLRVWPAVVLFATVMGGIYTGLFSPTESAGVGAAGALLLGILRSGMSCSQFTQALREAARTTVSLMTILIGSFVFAAFVNAARLPQDLVSLVTSAELAPFVVILMILATYLVLGCVLESISMMLLTVPVFYPVVAALGYDLIWFGVLVVVAVEISLITPPVGLNVFVLRSVLPEIDLKVIFRGVFPFVVVDLVRLTLVFALPGLALFLPELVG